LTDRPAGSNPPTAAITTIKWLLFCLLATTVPVVYFMFVVGGFLPLIAIVVFTVRDNVWGARLFDALHLAVYAPLFYWLAKTLARWLSLLSPRWSFLGFVGIAIVLLAISFLPLYGVGHNQSPGVNLYRLFRGGVMG
jgi:hypothetical protein